MSELLAPAGNLNAFYSAIKSGADAIYLGLNKFNARAFAENFTIDELKNLIEYAHLRNVRVFVTLNTILYDDELNELYAIIDELSKMHVDAIIFQDLAILMYVNLNHKNIELHASTQLGIDDLEGSKLLKELGVKRIVYARETPLNTLENIKNNLDIEIETFIHGALCVSYSGNCLMSSFTGNRSGNRGKCRGSCRQIYSLIDLKDNTIVKQGYLLSLKDLNTSSIIDKLRFIDSLKIEGRLKEPDYLVSVIDTYRKLLDKEKVDTNNLNKIFNRTYTTGYINNEDNINMPNFLRPNNFGYEIGEVIKVYEDKIYIKLHDNLSINDQIRIESNKLDEEIIINISQLFNFKYEKITSANKECIVYSSKKVKKGSKVYKTIDSNYKKDLQEIFNRKEYRRFKVNFELNIKIDEPIVIKVNFENINIYVKSKFKVEKALKSSISNENIYKQFNKLGDTPYEINEFKINKNDNNIFISLKDLNSLRRECVEELNKARLNKFKFNNKNTLIVNPKEISLNKTPLITIEVSNLEQFNLVKSLGFEHIYYKNKFRRNNLNSFELDNDYKEILAGGLNSIHYFQNKNIDIISDYSLNVSNFETVALLSSLNVKRITLSLELDKDHINDLVTNFYNKYHFYPSLEVIVYGRISLMHTKYCPLRALNMCGKCKSSNYALEDKYESFPIIFNDDCTLNILNSKRLNILDDLDKLNGMSAFRLIFTNESNEEIKEILENAKDKIYNNSNKKLFNNLTDTRGHFFKESL